MLRIIYPLSVNNGLWASALLVVSDWIDYKRILYMDEENLVEIKVLLAEVATLWAIQVKIS